MSNPNLSATAQFETAGRVDGFPRFGVWFSFQEKIFLKYFTDFRRVVISIYVLLNFMSG